MAKALGVELPPKARKGRVLSALAAAHVTPTGDISPPAAAVPVPEAVKEEELVAAGEDSTMDEAAPAAAPADVKKEEKKEEKKSERKSSRRGRSRSRCATAAHAITSLPWPLCLPSP